MVINLNVRFQVYLIYENLIFLTDLQYFLGIHLLLFNSAVLISQLVYDPLIESEEYVFRPWDSLA